MTRSHEYSVTVLVDGDRQTVVTVAASEDVARTQAVRLVRRMMPLAIKVKAGAAVERRYKPAA